MNKKQVREIIEATTNIAIFHCGSFSIVVTLKNNGSFHLKMIGNCNNPLECDMIAKQVIKLIAANRPARAKNC